MFLPSNLLHSESVILVVLVYSILADDPLAPADPHDLAVLRVSLDAGA